MTPTAALPTPDLVYLDTTGNGTVDSFMSVDVCRLDVVDSATGMWRVVETRASRIGVDGLPAQVHIVERVFAEQVAGHVEEVSTHEFELDPIDPSVARDLMARLERADAVTV